VIAAPAADARAITSSWSSTLNSAAPTLSVRYRLPGGLHDVTEHVVQVHRQRDRVVGAQEPPQPPLSSLHIPSPPASPERTESDLVALRCDADRDLVVSRLRHRARGASDADEQVAAALAAVAEPWPDAYEIRTDGDLDDSIVAAVARIRPSV
jgi:hypothetical protein